MSEVGVQATARRRRAAGSPRRRRAVVERRAGRIAAPIIALVLWQVVAATTESRILPAPADVVEAMIEQVRDGTLFEAFSVSLSRLVVGFLLALLVGSALGLAMGMSSRIEAILHDFVVVGLTFPYLIWGLLVAMWFGFEGQGPLVVVFIAGLPYVMLNVSEGVRDVSKDLRDMARAYEVPTGRVVRHVILPSLAPFFFASMRYGLANGWKGLVLAEVFAATSGAGYAINEMREYGHFSGVVGFALYFAAFSIAVEELIFGRLARRVFRWRPTTAHEVPEPTND